MVESSRISRRTMTVISQTIIFLVLAPVLLFVNNNRFIYVKAKAEHLLLFVSSASHTQNQSYTQYYRHSCSSSAINDKQCTFLSLQRQQQQQSLKNRKGILLFMPPLHLMNRCDEDNSAASAAQSLLEDDQRRLVDNDDTASSFFSTDCASIYESLHCALSKAMESNRRQYHSLTVEFEKAQQAEQLQHRADLLTANLYQFKTPGVLSISVQDWDGKEEVTLSVNTATYSSAQEEAQDLYQKARKMKRGSKVVQQLLQKSLQKETHFQQLLYDLECLGKNLQRVQAEEVAEDEADVTSQLEQMKDRIIAVSQQHELKISLTQTSNQKHQRQRTSSTGSNNNSNKHQQQHACRKFRSPQGFIVLVGRNQRDNEYISFHAARGKDIWFHARGCPGAHVLLQVRRGDPFPPSEEDVQFAANLAAYYSNARTERKAVITSAEPKHIQKQRGAPPGAVKLRQELGSVIGYPMDVAEELRRESDSSGGTWGNNGDYFEMGALGDKAKNRKRTLQVEKEKQAKKRAQRREKQQPRARRMQNDETAFDNVKDNDEWSEI